MLHQVILQDTHGSCLLTLAHQQSKREARELALTLNTAFAELKLRGYLSTLVIALAMEEE